MTYDVAKIRADFPILSREVNGKPLVYLDNGASAQKPQVVIDAVTRGYAEEYANVHRGLHYLSNLATENYESVRGTIARFLNAPSEDGIIMNSGTTEGINMVAYGWAMPRMQAGDEIVLSRMDHDANVEPWRLMARDCGLEVRYLSFDTTTFEFDLDELDTLLNERTRLVCVGGASNLTGTINDVKTICARAREVGAWSFIDAVQSAPHIVSDVQDFGCDFFVSSAYKFFGPHQGILWGRREVLEQLSPYKVRPAPDALPWCFETGTQSHEGMAGTAAAVDYFAWIGSEMAGAKGTRREAICGALDLLFDYERALADKLVRGLMDIDGVRILGITDEAAIAEIGELMNRRSLYLADGHHRYATALAYRQHLRDQGETIGRHRNTINCGNSVKIDLNRISIHQGKAPRIKTIDQCNPPLDRNAIHQRIILQAHIAILKVDFVAVY